MIDLNGKKAAKKLHGLLEGLCDANYKYARSCNSFADDVNGIRRRAYEKSGVQIKTSSNYDAMIKIFPSPNDHLNDYIGSTGLPVWTSNRGWLVNGPWEERIRLLLSALERELKAAHRQFRDAWSE